MSVVQEISVKEIYGYGEKFISEKRHEAHVCSYFSCTEKDLEFFVFFEFSEEAVEVFWLVLEISVHANYDVCFFFDCTHGSGFKAFAFSEVDCVIDQGEFWEFFLEDFFGFVC